jgi:predicted Zn finger-like uncharacterized protein
VQSACPSCGQKIAIDDAKVPERAFSVKCPKCATVVRFPGKAEAAAAAPPPPLAADVAPPQAPAEMRPEALAELKKELSRGSGGLGRALVALPDRNAASTVAGVLDNIGVAVDNIDNPEEGGRLIEQGLYTVVITTRVPAAQGRETLLQRVARLSPEARRRVLLVVLGEEYRSGDGTQAWSTNADLVLNPRDLANASAFLATTVAERRRLYQVFMDARERFEQAAAAHT